MGILANSMSNATLLTPPKRTAGGSSVVEQFTARDISRLVRGQESGGGGDFIDLGCGFRGKMIAIPKRSRSGFRN